MATQASVSTEGCHWSFY